MKPAAVVLCPLCLLALCVACVAAANPAPMEVPRLRGELEAVIEHGKPGDCGILVEILGRPSRHTLSDETLSLIGQHIKILEPCIIASQQRPWALDPVLQAEFRDHASPDGVALMREVLRRRIIVPEGALTLREEAPPLSWTTRQEVARTIREELLPAVDILAEYGNAADADLLTAVWDTLRTIPAEGLLFRNDEDPPSWFVQMAARRCRDRNAGAVFLCRPGGTGWQLVRADSEIVGSELEWQPRSPFPCRRSPGPPASRVVEILRRLGSSPAADRGVIGGPRTTTLKVRLRDGITATVTADSVGSIRYRDDRRYLDAGFTVDNPDLRRDILALTTSTGR